MRVADVRETGQPHRSAGRDAVIGNLGNPAAGNHADDMEILLSPPKAPRANAICERVVDTLRRELLDRMLIYNEAHAVKVMTEYIQHYNRHRPHRARNQLPPNAHEQPPPCTTSKAAHSCALKCSAASSTSTAAPRPDQQRRLFDPHTISRANNASGQYT
ncbi:integrase core domain-containing protein [Streptomyces sp. NPDC056002]|uniref:integrase core domain-containing protein n=1 Tax=Streptomyces sp. NPDC056002 TaxID=3345675 RepID=UPI0035E0D1B3